MVGQWKVESTMNVSVVIPAYNEAKRIEQVVRSARCYASEVIVVDDESSDGTPNVAREFGARVISQAHQGYIAAIKRGFRDAHGDVLITMDADGEHNAYDIPLLLQPIRDRSADLVFGAREKIDRPSERVLNWLAGLKLGLKDSGTGFRAIKRELATELDLNTWCTCGTLALEAVYRGGRITEVAIAMDRVNKKRHVAWGHVRQFFLVLRWLWRLDRKNRLKNSVLTASI